jgi:hypothetical protein
MALPLNRAKFVRRVAGLTFREIEGLYHLRRCHFLQPKRDVARISGNLVIPFHDRECCCDRQSFPKVDYPHRLFRIFGEVATMSGEVKRMRKSIRGTLEKLHATRGRILKTDAERSKLMVRENDLTTRLKRQLDELHEAIRQAQASHANRAYSANGTDADFGFPIRWPPAP